VEQRKTWLHRPFFMEEEVWRRRKDRIDRLDVTDEGA